MTQQLAAMLALASKARASESAAELRFLLLNETRSLMDYRQAVFWDGASETLALSGLVEVDKHTPYAQWLRAVIKALSRSHPKSAIVEAKDLPEDLRADWALWWPQFAWWQAPETAGVMPAVASLWASERLWTEADRALMGEWLDTWRHAAAALHGPRRHARGPARPNAGYKRWRLALVASGIVGALWLTPVHLSVLAPAELVPSQPIDVRAPLDGVVDAMLVQPNQAVQAQQALFRYDQALLDNDLKVAQEALAAAQSAYRQTLQRALSDRQAREQLSQLQGRIGELQSQVSYWGEQQSRAEVRAPQGGMVLLDDAASWSGKPVHVGERVLRIATPGDLEIEGWLSMADAIELNADAPVKLYLNARPLSPLSGRLKHIAFEASLRPDGQYAYRLRARLDAPVADMIGLKGTLKIEGEQVSALYWMARRPLASLRATLGW